MLLRDLLDGYVLAPHPVAYLPAGVTLTIVRQVGSQDDWDSVFISERPSGDGW